jgi:hypothetical protein
MAEHHSSALIEVLAYIGRGHADTRSVPHRRPPAGGTGRDRRLLRARPFASYLPVVKQIGDVSQGGYFLVFWMFQNPPDLIYSIVKAMVMATAIVPVGCYYGYHASGGPVGVGRATARSMVLNIVLVHLIGMLGTQVFWGANPRAPIGG